MVIVRIKGGLGNQLFQYSVGYSLARRLNQELIMDTSFFPNQSLRGYKLCYLNIDKNSLFDDKKYRYIKLLKNKYINKLLRMADIRKIPLLDNSYYLLETRSELVNEFFNIEASNIYLDGYYQSEKYFKQYRNELLQQITPVYSKTENIKKLYYKIKHVNSVAVHVRRGDFLKAKNDFNPRHYLLDKQYYEYALEYVNNHIDKPTFYWFSDDIEWVKQQFGKRDNYNYISVRSQNSDIDELMLMKSCKHIITANSTFSWWAAWLNENDDAIKIVPKQRYGNVEMIPENWIKI